MAGAHVEITDSATGVSATVSQEGVLQVIAHQHPPVSDTLLATPFRSYMTTSAGSSSMLVNGGTTPVTFSILADLEYDIYIKTISFQIVDASAVLNKFGNITALTNGCTLTWNGSEQGTVTIGDSLKTNWDMVRLALGNPSFGDAANSFRASNVQGTSEGFIPFLDFSLLFGLTWGLQLRAGTTDSIKFTINDDITTLDAIDAIGYGVKIKAQV